LIQEGISALPETDRNAMTLFLSWLAEAHALNGELSVALETAEKALEVNPVELSWWIDALRIRGELRVQAGQTVGAEYDLRETIALAQKIGAKALELRAAMSLSRLLQARDDATSARDLLTPIYNWFTEGFDTTELKEAKELLDNLSGG
jgi:predicted ATPase